MYLNCLCANLAYGLPELNKTYLLKTNLHGSLSLATVTGDGNVLIMSGILYG